MQYQVEYQSPIGALRIVEEDGALIRVEYLNKKKTAFFNPKKENQDSGHHLKTSIYTEKTALLEQTVWQLQGYFAGKRKSFDVPLKPQGTPFQQRVWQALLEIPYGETRSYSDIAEAIGNPKAVRAVGMANHNNPIMILIPCHRVIGKNHDMTGYACGIEVKKALLQLEGVFQEHEEKKQKI